MTLPTFKMVQDHANKFFMELYYEYFEEFPSLHTLEIKVHNRTASSLGNYKSRFMRSTGEIISHEINLYVKSFTELKVCGLKEYVSFRGTNIGDIQTDDWRLVLETIICHELAHTMVVSSMLGINEPDVQYGLIGLRGRPLKSGHDKYFKGFYAHLRLKYINNKVKLVFDLPETFEGRYDEFEDETRAKYRRAGERHIPQYLGRKFSGGINSTKNKKFEIIGYRPRAYANVIAVCQDDKLYAYRLETVQYLMLEGQR